MTNNIEYDSDAPYSEHQTKAEIKKSKRNILIPIILVIIVLVFIALFIIVAYKSQDNNGEDGSIGYNLTKDKDKSYVCDEDYYNCDDFSTQQDAQEVFDFCGGADNDIHRLDLNNDSVACENLG